MQIKGKKINLGELTFYPTSGMGKWTIQSVDWSLPHIVMPVFILSIHSMELL